MTEKLKIGIIICDRYRRCAGGKCLRAMREKAGAFSIYQDEELELAGYTTCDGCPGGNVEYAGEEMVRNGAQAKYLAMHEKLGTWQDAKWDALTAPTMADAAIRAAYD